MTESVANLVSVIAPFAIFAVVTPKLTNSAVLIVFPAIAVDSVTFPVPSKDTALAVTSPDSAKFLAFARAVAEDTVPVTFPMNVPATNVSEPTVHLPALSSQNSDLLVWFPLSTSIPASCDGVPVSSEFRVIMLSPMLTLFESVVVVVPLTVRLPPIVKFPTLMLSFESPRLKVPRFALCNAALTFVVSVTSALASIPSMVTRLAGVISSMFPAPEESLPSILFVADTFCILAYVIASLATSAVAIVPSAIMADVTCTSSTVPVEAFPKTRFAVPISCILS